MATKKITLTELRRIVKQIVKEESSNNTSNLKAIVDTETGEIKSRGLDDYMVDYLMIEKNWNQYPNLEVVSDSDIKKTYIDSIGKQFRKNDKDRTKLKSQLFFVSNTYKDDNGNLKYVELKPFKHNISVFSVAYFVDKIFVYSNSVVFYGNNKPIDEIKNISMDSNVELAGLIENRLRLRVK